MTQVDLSKLDVAITYVERMAEGNNPVKNLPAEEDSVLNNPNVIRCMYFIRDVLVQVKENGGVIQGSSGRTAKRPFPFEVLSRFEYEEDRSISHFLAQIKALADTPNVKGIGTKPVTDWLKSMGYLVEEYDSSASEKRTRTTEKGEEFGLYMDRRVSMMGKEYQVIMYSRKAQEFIVQNMEAIINGEICE